MDKKQFIKKMNEYNYTDEKIEEFIELIEECKAIGLEVKYEQIALEKSDK